MVEVKPGSDFGAGAGVLLPIRPTADGGGYRPTTSRRKTGNLRITIEEDRTTLAVRFDSSLRWPELTKTPNVQELNDPARREHPPCLGDHVRESDPGHPKLDDGACEADADPAVEEG